MTSLPEAAGAVTAAPRKRRFPIQGTDLILLGLGVASTIARIASRAARPRCRS